MIRTIADVSSLQEIIQAASQISIKVTINVEECKSRRQESNLVEKQLR